MKGENYSIINIRWILYSQMSGGGRHYIRVRRIVPLHLGAQRNSALQSVGI